MQLLFPGLFPLLHHLIPEALLRLWMSLALNPAATGSVEHRGSLWQLLTETRPVFPCYQNLTMQTQYNGQYNSSEFLACWKNGLMSLCYSEDKPDNLTLRGCMAMSRVFGVCRISFEWRGCFCINSCEGGFIGVLFPNLCELGMYRNSWWMFSFILMFVLLYVCYHKCIGVGLYQFCIFSWLRNLYFLTSMCL